MSNNVYFWWGLALILMAAEAFMPGAFLLWLGFAGAAMGVLVWLAPSLPGVWQAAAFALFAVISVEIYRRFVKPREPRSDKPLLNQRAAQLVGRSLVLKDAINGGRGKEQIGDALWSLTGPDLPAGTRVVVTGFDGMVLIVAEPT